MSEPPDRSRNTKRRDPPGFFLREKRGGEKVVEFFCGHPLNVRKTEYERDLFITGSTPTR
jgi:hypothetical protein